MHNGGRKPEAEASHTASVCYLTIEYKKMITKNKLAELLEVKKEENKAQDFYYRGDYHDIGLSELSDIVDMMEDGTEYEDYSEVIDKLQYNGSISEYADSSTPIYYYDIAKWFGENYSAVDEYIDEMGDCVEGSNGKADIMKTIQGAHFLSYERDIQSALESLIDELPEEEEAEEVTA